MNTMSKPLLTVANTMRGPIFTAALIMLTACGSGSEFQESDQISQGAEENQPVDGTDNQPDESADNQPVDGTDSQPDEGADLSLIHI